MQMLPNILTLSRVAVIPLLVAVFFFQGEWTYWAAAGLFLYASITDFLDGHLARAWKAQSAFGTFLDPIADKLLVATALMLLVWKGRADLLPALAILCREILVSGLREFLATIQVSVPVTRLAKWKTAAQMAAILLLLWGKAGPSWLYIHWSGNGLLWIAAILTLVTGYAYLRTGLKHMEA